MNNVFSTKEFEEAFYYDGQDLGVSYTAEETAFRVWAPTASGVSLLLYREGSGENCIEKVLMEADVKGTWYVCKSGDLNGVYYTYEVMVDGVKKETIDPYAKAAGVNGKRGMILDLRTTDPDGFREEKKPEFYQMTDAVIYELHIRDLSVDESSGISKRGKFLALTETGTKNAYGQATGLDHLKELGITHLHLMPSFDFASVDESKTDTEQFNWGYDPLNYNVPEGSYSTDPYHGEVRVKEFKQMVQALHKNGIRVVMDVVYNHTYSTDSSFERIVPGYYYRMDGEHYTNGSGCGNETASERVMVRKFIVDSVCYWATEYHIDGFRFDLMGVHDIDTMNAVRDALNAIDPSIIIYGEGWTGGYSGLPYEKRALKSAAARLNGIAVFNDDMRDGLKGSVFDAKDQGFISGKQGVEENIKCSIAGGICHGGIDTGKILGPYGWAGDAAQCINYVSCHDNLTLWDKLALSCKEISLEDRKRMNKLAAAIVFTSQGVPFIQAGEEFLRSKPNADHTGYDSNSYASSDATNSIKWNELHTNADIYAYYKELIAFRKKHPGFRYISPHEINQNLTFFDTGIKNVLAYQIHYEGEDMQEDLLILHNANPDTVEITLPNGKWTQCADELYTGEAPIKNDDGKICVEKISTAIFMLEAVSKEDETKAEVEDETESSDEKVDIVSVTSIPEKKDLRRSKGAWITAGLAALATLALILGLKKKR
ncbi:MAG: type I pullulanase [Lachnospiraceae bacterium]|nr:type I pullulanase [Lachnospiraceae bacterium]